jgi:branched-chain amino acid transport system substrate-binding protein
MTHARFWAAALLLALALAHPAAAQKNYAPGISDSEIKIGQTMPYSGPASAYGAVGLAELAYFHMLNEQGGVNGRKINLISLDDGYSPPKTVEQTRRLVEQEGVAFIFGSLGTPTNAAVQKYVNDRKVPQLLIASGGNRFADPAHFKFTMRFNPSFLLESRVYGRYIRDHRPDAKVAVLYQNDDFGKELLQGMKDGLGDSSAKLMVATASYEVTDANVDSQIVTLQASGADMLFTAATPKFAAMSIRKVYDIGWRPLHFLNLTSNGVSAVLQPAGIEKSIGLISSTYLKDATDPRWKDDPAYRDWLAWMKKYNPTANPADIYNVHGYTIAMTLVQVLKQCGDDLSRENIMHQAANLHELVLPMMQPGITITTGPADYEPVKQLRLVRFDGETWAPFAK